MEALRLRFKTNQVRVMNKHQYDVIVIGAGGAGLSAVAAIPKGLKVAVLSKLFHILMEVFIPLIFRQRSFWKNKM